MLSGLGFPKIKGAYLRLMAPLKRFFAGKNTGQDKTPLPEYRNFLELKLNPRAKDEGKNRKCLNLIESPQKNLLAEPDKAVLKSAFTKNQTRRQGINIDSQKILELAQRLQHRLNKKLQNELAIIKRTDTEYNLNPETCKAFAQSINEYNRESQRIFDKIFQETIPIIQDAELEANDLDLAKSISILREISKKIGDSNFALLGSVINQLPKRRIQGENILNIISQECKDTVLELDLTRRFGLINDDVAERIIQVLTQDDSATDIYDLNNTLVIKSAMYESLCSAMRLREGEFTIPNQNTLHDFINSNYEKLNGMIDNDFDNHIGALRLARQRNYREAVIDPRILDYKELVAKCMKHEIEQNNLPGDFNKDEIYLRLNIYPKKNPRFFDQEYFKHRARFSNIVEKTLADGGLLNESQKITHSFFDKSGVFRHEYIREIYETRLLASLAVLNSHLKLGSFEETPQWIKSIPSLRKRYDAYKGFYSEMIRNEETESKILETLDQAATLAAQLTKFGSFQADSFLRQNRIEKLGEALLNEIGSRTDIGAMSVSLNFISNFFNPLHKFQKELQLSPTHELALRRCISDLHHKAFTKDQEGNVRYAKPRPSPEGLVAYNRMHGLINSPGWLMAEVPNILSYIDRSLDVIEEESGRNYPDHILMSFWFLSVINKFLAHPDQNNPHKIQSTRTLQAWLNIIRTSLREDLLFNPQAPQALKFKIAMYTFAQRAHNGPDQGCLVSRLIQEINYNLNLYANQQSSNIPLPDLIQAHQSLRRLLENNRATLDRLEAQKHFGKIERGEDLIKLETVLPSLIENQTESLIPLATHDDELKSLITKIILKELKAITDRFQGDTINIRDDDETAMGDFIQFHKLKGFLYELYDASKFLSLNKIPNKEAELEDNLRAIENFDTRKIRLIRTRSNKPYAQNPREALISNIVQKASTNSNPRWIEKPQTSRSRLVAA